jgi:FkbM family methyltransferase
MRVRTDDMIGRVLAISGVWEPNVTAVFSGALAPGVVCLDIGAHIGYHTLLASKLVGSRGHVYAFEPSPESYRRLRANVDLNGLRNVTTAQLAVGEEERRAVLYMGAHTTQVSRPWIPCWQRRTRRNAARQSSLSVLSRLSCLLRTWRGSG